MIELTPCDNTNTLLALNIQNVFRKKHVNSLGICTKEIPVILPEAIGGIEILTLT